MLLKLYGAISGGNEYYRKQDIVNYLLEHVSLVQR